MRVTVCVCVWREYSMLLTVFDWIESCPLEESEYIYTYPTMQNNGIHYKMETGNEERERETDGK